MLTRLSYREIKRKFRSFMFFRKKNVKKAATKFMPQLMETKNWLVEPHPYIADQPD